MKNAAKFWDRIAMRYSRKPVGDEAAYHEKLKITRSYLNPDAVVLEIGCGTGSTALIHAPHVKHIRAIDFSKKMLEIAEQKRKSAGIENISFDCATLDDVDSGETKYDVILGLSVLHLLRDWRDSILKIESLLKPGGIFISSTACIGDSMKWFKFIAAIGGSINLLPEIQVFTTPELEDGIRSAGLQIEQQWQPGKNKGVFIVARKPA